MRGNSAVDIALWDIFGKVCGQPSGKRKCSAAFRGTTIRTYNTCAGVLHESRRADRFRQLRPCKTNKADRYADLDAFLTRADDLAEDLLSEGISAMKIWPFDAWRPEARSSGQHIDAAALKSGAFDPSRRSASASAIAWTSWSSSTRWRQLMPRDPDRPRSRAVPHFLA